MEIDPLSSAERRVDAYLDQVLAPLNRRLSSFQRAELRRELQAHLRERIEAYIRLGMSNEEAADEALQQFGGAEDFLKQWQQEWAQSSGHLTIRTIYEAGRSALKPSLKGIISVNLLYIVVQECIWHLPHSAAVALMNRHSDAMGWSMAGFAFLLLPLLVGSRYGRRTPERAGIGIVAALAAELTAASLIYGTVAWASSDGVSTGITVTDMLFNFLLGLMAVWIPVAGGAAAISSSKARRLENRRLA